MTPAIVSQGVNMAWLGEMKKEFTLPNGSGFSFKIMPNIRAVLITPFGPLWKNGDQPRIIQVYLADRNKKILYPRTFLSSEVCEINKAVFDDCVTRGLYWICLYPKD